MMPILISLFEPFSLQPLERQANDAPHAEEWFESPFVGSKPHRSAHVFFFFHLWQIIHEKVYDTFLARLTAAYKQIVTGDPLKEGTLLGPLHTKAAVKEFKEGIEKILSQVRPSSQPSLFVSSLFSFALIYSLLPFVNNKNRVEKSSSVERSWSEKATLSSQPLWRSTTKHPL
jgi:hypothetical protein